MNGVIGLTELLLEAGLDPEQRELASGVKVSAENRLPSSTTSWTSPRSKPGRSSSKRSSSTSPTSPTTSVGSSPRPPMPRAWSFGRRPRGCFRALLGDPVRIQQVLLNLGSNAVKFTSEGEVVIRARVLDWKIERVALRFEVTDIGIGIALVDQARLFLPFSQADSSTTRRFGGTGLGLAICRQLVGLMGGNLGLLPPPREKARRSGSSCRCADAETAASSRRRA